jgi:hypothetical protein
MHERLKSEGKHLRCAIEADKLFFVHYSVSTSDADKTTLV